MIKAIIKLLLFFSFLGFKAQSTKDTLRRNNYEETNCDKVRKNNRIFYVKLKKEARKIDYNSLRRIIISDIDVKKLMSQNIVIQFHKQEVYSAFGMTICGDVINVQNPNFNYLDFWTKETIENIQGNIRKNIFFDVSDSKFEKKKDIELKKEIKSHSFYQYLLEMNNYEDYYYDNRTSIYKPLTTEKADYLYIDFRNKLNNIVVVKFDYFPANEIIYKTYQYQNKKWKEIPTNDENKF